MRIPFNRFVIECLFNKTEYTILARSLDQDTKYERLIMEHFQHDNRRSFKAIAQAAHDKYLDKFGWEHQGMMKRLLLNSKEDMTP